MIIIPEHKECVDALYIMYWRLWNVPLRYNNTIVHVSGYNYPLKEEGVKYTYSVNVIAYHLSLLKLPYFQNG